MVIMEKLQVGQIYKLEEMLFEVTKIYPFNIKVKISGKTSYGSQKGELLELKETTTSSSKADFLQFISEYKLEL